MILRRLRLLRMVLFLWGMLPFCGIGMSPAMAETMPFPIPLEHYAAQESVTENLGSILGHRIRCSPFNLVATLLFLAAILHTLCASRLTQLAKRMAKNSQIPSFRIRLLHLLGETEIIFGLWVIPLCLAIALFFGRQAIGT
ncbi:MAG: hypothetical protein LBG98_03490, partial [Puniceicoccales bacterium]|nr:hypothetical protein [Puniceicoccales bacterium]